MNGPYFPAYLELFRCRILNLYLNHPLIPDIISNDPTRWKLHENVLISFDVFYSHKK